MYRLIPKMDEILENNQVKKLSDQYSVEFVKSIINDRLNGIRNMIKDNKSEDEIKAEIRNLEVNIVNDCNNYLAPRLRRLVNATGTVIHTNLGRSVISERMAKSLVDILTHYSNLEYDIHTGKRGLRYTNIEELITNITGTEAALVVNNNAAAVFLVLSEFAKGGEAIISRGELIEIGGSFRIPDVMEFSGCKLKEIGTTNKTHLYDYERAISEDTKVILKVHTSNYKVVGFTEGVSSTELKELADKYNLPLIEDLGSGVFVDLEKYGLMHEPTVMDSINAGIDIITFSGDKLLGGPQAGIIVGKKKYIDALKKNPMTRALRVDKMALKLLEEVLKEYIDRDKAHKNIPTLNMLTLPIDELKKRSTDIKNK
ncbi:MAG: L-seryl-tRNA(Sec) selenium transferase, partial [Ezakiella massiliensis]